MASEIFISRSTGAEVELIVVVVKAGREGYARVR